MIITNHLDKNIYKYKVLENGANFLFIQDPMLDKSAISISVKTGSLNDNIHGMAHFLEHMLFMGTEKYPKENEFAQYLSLHNGNYNAITYDDITVYFFDIDPKYFINCLQIFSQFFVSPLFDASCIEREMCAVDSEYKMNLRSDLWRVERLASKFSVFDSFGVGNKNTLNHKNVREMMIDFYETNYSSDKMSIVVYHNEDITDFIANEFSNVKKNKHNKNTLNTNLIDNFDTLNVFDKKNDTHNNFTSSLYNKSFLNKLIYVESIKDVKELQIRVEVPKIYKNYKNKSYEYIKFVMLNKNKNSLIDKLKKEGYSYDLSFSYDNTLYFSTCNITVNLTSKGYKNIQSVLEMIKNTLRYCEVSKSKYKKIKEIENKNFKYKEMINSCDFVFDISYDMQYYPVENVLNHSYVYEKYDQDEIEAVLQILGDNKNWLIFLLAQNIVEDVCDENNKKLKRCEDNKMQTNTYVEEYYGTKYIIGEDITIKDKISLFKEQNSGYTYTFIYNNDYKIPKSIVTVKLNKKIENSDFVGLLFYVECLNDLFFEKYDDFLYFNSIDLNAYVTKSGVEIVVEGFNTKIEETLDKYIYEIKNLSKEIIEANFEIIKEKLIDTYIRIKNKQSYKRLFDFYKAKVFDELQVDEIISKLEQLKPQDVIMYNKCYIDVFVVGNEDFKSIVKMLCNSFEQNEIYDINKETDAYKIDFDNTKTKNINTTTVYKTDQIDYTLKFTSEDKHNNSVGLFIETGLLSDYKNIAKNIVILQLSKELFFDTLRTKESLGYVTTNSCYKIKNKFLVYFVVQSQKNIEFLKTRIFDFLNEMNIEIQKLSFHEFETLKEGAINMMEEEYKNLEDFYGFYKSLYVGNCLILDYRERIIREIKELKKENLTLFENFTFVEGLTKQE